MILPELIKETRQRLSDGDEPVNYALRAAYLWGARASEVIAVASGTDTTTPYGPRGSDVTEEAYNLPSGEREPVAVFRLRTAKRGGKERLIAIPLNEKYEPLARPLFNYCINRGNDFIFQFTRQTLYNHATAILDGLKYDIASQNANGVKVETHERGAAVHFLRHIRASELSYYYGFQPVDLAAYCGWTLQNAGFSDVMARYQHLAWQSYFPKFLIPRP